MTQRLKGKNVLVTAAAQGIGRASVLALAAEGAKVFASDVNMTALSTIREENHENIEIFELDARDDASVAAGVERAQPDVLFNCAGFVHNGTILDASDDELDFAFDLNVRSMLRTIRAALPGMLARGSGSIINMSSACSSIIGAPNRFVYGTTKAAVLGLTKSVAIDYITQGIRCNAICPGFVETAHGLKEIAELDAAGQEWEASGMAATQGRICYPEEVAAAVVFLASDEASFVNGNATYVDNGWYAKG